MKKKELDTNPLNDLFHALSMERKQRDTKEEPKNEEIEDDSDLSEIEDKKRRRGLAAESLSKSYSLKIPEGRNTTAHIKSVDTGGNAVLKASPIYTGTKVKGIATMHKSNAVPVFSDEEAQDISKMRR